MNSDQLQTARDTLTELSLALHRAETCRAFLARLLAAADPAGAPEPQATSERRNQLRHQRDAAAELAASYFGVHPETLWTEERSFCVASARHLVFHLMRKQRASTKEIAATTHCTISTVRNGLRSIQNLIDTNPLIRERVPYLLAQLQTPIATQQQAA